MPLFDPPYVFLTTKPRIRLLSVDHPEWLSILPLQEPTDPVSLYALITYTDGATAEHELIADMELSNHVVRTINISYQVRDYNAVTPAKTIRKIRIYTKSADADFEFATNPTNDEITYYPYTPKSDTLKAIYYNNSYGGWDSLIGTGDQQESLETSALLTRKTIVAVNQNQTDHNYSYQQQLAVQQFMFHSGFKPKAEIKALRCLQLIKSAYEYFPDIDGNPAEVPILILGNVISFPMEKSNLWALEFTYRYTFDERSFDRVGE